MVRASTVALDHDIRKSVHHPPPPKIFTKARSPNSTHRELPKPSGNIGGQYESRREHSQPTLANRPESFVKLSVPLEPLRKIKSCPSSEHMSAMAADSNSTLDSNLAANLMPSNSQETDITDDPKEDLLSTRYVTPYVFPYDVFWPNFGTLLGIFFHVIF